MHERKTPIAVIAFLSIALGPPSPSPRPTPKRKTSRAIRASSANR